MITSGKVICRGCFAPKMREGERKRERGKREKERGEREKKK